MSNIGKKIRSLRQQKNMTAKDLALLIGKDGGNPAQYIYDIESGKVKNISILVIGKIAQALGVDISVFTNEEEGIPEQQSTYNKPGFSPGTASLEEKYIHALEEISRLQNIIIEIQKNSK